MQSGGYLCRWVGYVRKRGTAGSRNKKMISRSWNLLKTCLALLLLLFAFIAECQLLASSRRLILFKFQHRHLVSEYYVVQSRLNEKANHFVYYNSIHSRIETSCLQRAQSIPTQLCAKDTHTHTQRIRKKENFVGDGSTRLRPKLPKLELHHTFPIQENFSVVEGFLFRFFPGTTR